MLGDGELEGVFQNWPCFRGATEGDERFAKLDVDDHPVGLLHAERAEMVDGAGIIVRVDVRLREVEAGQIVVGEPLPQLARFGDSVVTHGVLLR